MANKLSWTIQPTIWNVVKSAVLVTVSAEDDFPARVAVEAVPVVPLPGQHVQGGPPVSLLLHPRLGTLRSNLVLKLTTLLTTFLPYFLPSLLPSSGQQTQLDHSAQNTERRREK